jgi:cyclase
MMGGIRGFKTSRLQVPKMSSVQLCLCAFLALLFTPIGRADSANFRTVPVAKDVYALIAKPGTLGTWGIGNTTFIVNQNDVVVVDTLMRPSLITEVIAEIRKVTDKPVRYVINTHWHRDHTQGNQVYLDVYGPGVTIIQQDFAREDQLENQQNELYVRAPADLAKVEKMLADGKDEQGNPLDSAGRGRLTQLLAAQKAYAAEIPNIRPTFANLTFSKSLVLHEGNRDICLYYFGYAHTRGDLVVYLPAEKIVLTGDMNQTGVPDTRRSYPLKWLTTMHSLYELDWNTNIPGHGDVQYGREALNVFVAYLDDLVTGVKAAVAKNLTVDETVKAVDLRKYSEMRDFDEKNEGAIRRTYDEVTGKVEE